MSNTQTYNYCETIEVARDVYWVGFHDEEETFHSNPYLFIDQDEAILFAPAGMPDFATVATKIFSMVNPANIRYVALNHQDPDICACLGPLQDMLSSDSTRLLSHSQDSMLINNYGTKLHFYNFDQHDYTLTLKSGRVLRFLVTPFCHFPKATATYDEQEGLLFSSDLFGAISKDWELFAREGYQEQMRSFHMRFMASNRHLRTAMETIEKLTINMILPQHGSIIKGEMIQTCIDFLKELPCGIDAPETRKELYGWMPTCSEPTAT